MLSVPCAEPGDAEGASMGKSHRDPPCQDCFPAVGRGENRAGDCGILPAEILCQRRKSEACRGYCGKGAQAPGRCLPWL